MFQSTLNVLDIFLVLFSDQYHFDSEIMLSKLPVEPASAAGLGLKNICLKKSKSYRNI